MKAAEAEDWTLYVRRQLRSAMESPVLRRSRTRDGAACKTGRPRSQRPATTGRHTAAKCGISETLARRRRHDADRKLDRHREAASTLQHLQRRSIQPSEGKSSEQGSRSAQRSRRRPQHAGPETSVSLCKCRPVAPPSPFLCLHPRSTRSGWPGTRLARSIDRWWTSRPTSRPPFRRRRL